MLIVLNPRAGQTSPAFAPYQTARSGGFEPLLVPYDQIPPSDPSYMKANLSSRSHGVDFVGDVYYVGK